MCEKVGLSIILLRSVILKCSYLSLTERSLLNLDLKYYGRLRQGINTAWECGWNASQFQTLEWLCSVWWTFDNWP